MSGLPKGWAEIRLGDLAEARMGETILAKQLTPTGVPVYSAGQENVAWGFFENPKKMLGKGTVIISARGSIGFPKVPKADQFVSTQTTISLRFPNEGLAAFACHWLNTVDWGGLTKGGAIPMLTVGDTNQLIVPIPPHNEQLRIMAKLAELLSRVEASQRRLAKIPVILKRFRQAVLSAACSGRLTADWREENGISIETEWKQVHLSDICCSIADGDHQPPPQRPSGIPFLTIGNISKGKLDFSETRFVQESYFSEIKPNRKPIRGDILYTVVGATVGIPVLVDTDRPFCFQRHIAILKPSTVTSSEFLFIVMGSLAVFQEAWSRVTGSAQPTLPLGNLRSIPSELPPLPEQHEIVRRVEALFTLADQIEARYRKAKTHVDRLTQAILAKAFRGELVPQNENDEPASVLLERIRAARAESVPKPRPKASTRSTRKSYEVESVEPLAKAAEPEAPYGEATIPDAILAAMQPGQAYNRTELAGPLKLSPALWNHGIRQLKAQGLVRQVGEKRAARYIRAS